MGFWGKTFDVVKTVGTFVYNELEEAVNENREIKKKQKNLSDSKLRKIRDNDSFLGSSSKERAFAASKLKKKKSVEEIR